MIFNTEYGEIEAKNVMFDIDGTNLEEGVEITTLSGDILLQLYEYINLNDLETKDIENLLKNNI